MGRARSRLVWVCLATALAAAGCHRAGAVAAGAGPLPSWNEGPAKQAMLDLVKVTTDKGSAGFVPIEDRIATFDQDGTLWVEHPLYAQGMFALDRVRALASQHPDWKTTEPFKSVLAGDMQAIAKFPESDWEKIIAVTHAGMTTNEFVEDVRALAGHGPPPALPPGLHRAHLSTHARSDALPARQRLQDVHRHRWRSGVRSCLRDTGLRGSTRAGDRFEPAHEVRAPGRQAGAAPRAKGVPHRRQGRKAGGHQPVHRQAADRGVRELQRRRRDAAVDGDLGPSRAADDAGPPRRRASRIRLRSRQWPAGHQGRHLPAGAPGPGEEAAAGRWSA